MGINSHLFTIPASYKFGSSQNQEMASLLSIHLFVIYVYIYIIHIRYNNCSSIDPKWQERILGLCGDVSDDVDMSFCTGSFTASCGHRPVAVAVASLEVSKGSVGE